MFEEAMALSTMMKMCKLTQRELADKLGTSQSYVANKLRLLTLPSAVRDRILELRLCERHARAVLRLKDVPLMLEAVEKISAMHLTASEAEALAEVMDIRACTEERAPISPHEGIEDFMDILSRAIVQLRRRGVRVEKFSDIGEKRSYITLCIEN